jgi:hypothetical protein
MQVLRWQGFSLWCVVGEMHATVAAKQVDLRRCRSKQKPVLQFGADSSNNAAHVHQELSTGGVGNDQAQG